ncbi:hypothetical protein EYF80_060221 [Liparis tanakae]|uniref:Uncharacterized protein n=1 Tax=Liparis tanakae TaxID=230148 RepID=A0A4Z2EM38_9TELE|nr:hypothetical protein EYF80_060221 [Liparis tanakae]
MQVSPCSAPRAPDGGVTARGYWMPEHSSAALPSSMECTKHCIFTAATAKLTVCDEEEPESRALQVQYLRETGPGMVVGSYCGMRVQR